MLREHGALLISLLAMMLSTGMPELQAESDLEYMRTALQLNDNITKVSSVVGLLVKICRLLLFV